MYTVDELNERLIDLAFSEDIGDGDHTTLCCIPETEMGKSQLIIKESGILAGIRIAQWYSSGLIPPCRLKYSFLTALPSILAM